MITELQSEYLMKHMFFTADSLKQILWLSRQQLGGFPFVWIIVKQ